MKVKLGHSGQFGRGFSPSVHLVVEVADRQVLSCTGGAVKDVREFDFEHVLQELRCNRCSRFWRKAMVQPSTPT